MLRLSNQTDGFKDSPSKIQALWEDIYFWLPLGTGSVT